VVPEPPLPECAAPQGPDEDGPQGYPGSKLAHPGKQGGGRSRGKAKP
jgi:hypothetical protein